MSELEVPSQLKDAEGDSLANELRAQAVRVRAAMVDVEAGNASLKDKSDVLIQSRKLIEHAVREGYLPSLRKIWRLITYVPTATETSPSPRRVLSINKLRMSQDAWRFGNLADMSPSDATVLRSLANTLLDLATDVSTESLDQMMAYHDQRKAIAFAESVDQLYARFETAHRSPTGTMLSPTPESSLSATDAYLLMRLYYRIRTAEKQAAGGHATWATSVVLSKKSAILIMLQYCAQAVGANASTLIASPSPMLTQDQIDLERTRFFLGHESNRSRISTTSLQEPSPNALAVLRELHRLKMPRTRSDLLKGAGKNHTREKHLVDELESLNLVRKIVPPRPLSEGKGRSRGRTYYSITTEGTRLLADSKTLSTIPTVPKMSP